MWVTRWRKPLSPATPQMNTLLLPTSTRSSNVHTYLRGKQSAALQGVWIDPWPLARLLAGHKLWLCSLGTKKHTPGPKLLHLLVRGQKKSSAETKPPHSSIPNTKVMPTEACSASWHLAGHICSPCATRMEEGHEWPPRPSRGKPRPYCPYTVPLTDPVVGAERWEMKTELLHQALGKQGWSTEGVWQVPWILAVFSSTGVGGCSRQSLPLQSTKVEIVWENISNKTRKNTKLTHKGEEPLFTHMKLCRLKYSSS